MPVSVNPIRKSLLKQSLLKGKSIRQSMKDAGYSPKYAHGNCDRNEPVVRACIKEIMSDAERAGIISEAWEVVREGLKDKKHKYALAQALTTKSMIEKREVENLTPDKIIISYHKHVTATPTTDKSQIASPCPTINDNIKDSTHAQLTEDRASNELIQENRGIVEGDTHEK